MEFGRIIFKIKEWGNKREQWQKDRWPEDGHEVHAQVEEIGIDDHVGMNPRVLLRLLYQ